MRRLTMGSFGAALVAIAFGVSGCGGSSELGEGMPLDTSTPPPPPNSQMKMLPVNKQVHGKSGGTRGHASVSRDPVGRQV
jgi:hypothetical protein